MFPSFWDVLNARQAERPGAQITWGYFGTWARAKVAYDLALEFHPRWDNTGGISVIKDEKIPSQQMALSRAEAIQCNRLMQTSLGDMQM